MSQILSCRSESASHSLSIFSSFLPKRAEVEILLDLLVRAFLGFVVAALAASSAVKGNSKLHISMIRCLSARPDRTMVLNHLGGGIESAMEARRCRLIDIWSDGSYMFVNTYIYCVICTHTYTHIYAHINTYKHI